MNSEDRMALENIDEFLNDAGKIVSIFKLTVKFGDLSCMISCL